MLVPDLEPLLCPEEPLLDLPLVLLLPLLPNVNPLLLPPPKLPPNVKPLPPPNT